jgi:hypothetical protein
MENLKNLSDMELLELHEKNSALPDTPTRAEEERRISSEMIERLDEKAREAMPISPPFYPR